MKKYVCLSIVLCFCCLPQMLWALTVSNPNYQVETYISYNTSEIGQSLDFTFDSSGNTYVTHTAGTFARNGSIRKIDTNKNVTVLRDDLVDPRYITWGGGTAFGDYLYVTDRFEHTTYPDGQVTKIDLLGNKSAFSGSQLDQPTALEIDRTGNYGGQLYIANSDNDRISYTTSAGGSAPTFASYPYGTSGSIQGIAFDTTGSYGGSMFVGTHATNLQYAGLFHIDINGNESRYTDFEQACCIAFDDTAQQYFNGKMFAAGRDDDLYRWTLYQVNGFYDTEVFGTFNIGPGWTRPAMQFGPDGALYVMEYNENNKDMIISRITPVPEPATLLLMSLGCFILKKFN